jgi:hypothetical protein
MGRNEMKHVWNTISLLLLVTMVFAIGAADARTQFKAKFIERKVVPNGEFNITARYTGSFEGRTIIGNQQVEIPEETPVYVVGEGIQDTGYFSSDQVVYVSGMHKRGKSVVSMVVVRPSESDSESTGSRVGIYAIDNPQ